MEISAVQALCSYLNINYFPFIYGADRLDENIYNPSVLGNLNIDKRLIHYEIAKKIALIIDNRYYKIPYRLIWNLHYLEILFTSSNLSRFLAFVLQTAFETTIKATPAIPLINPNM